MKIYIPTPNRDDQSKKEIIVELRRLGKSEVSLVAVDEAGSWITDLLLLSADGVDMFCGAEDTLKRSNYDTSELKWDDDGALKVVE